MACGTGGWTGPLPGDPDNTSILTATATFGGIAVSWTWPGLNAHAVAHTRLYRGTSNIFANAALYRIVAGDYYFDRTFIESATSVEYFYWIEIVSINGTTGETIGPASATALPPLDEYLEFLSGQIDQSVLGVALSSKIDEIDTNYIALLQEQVDRAANDDSLGAAFTLLEAYSDETRALVLAEELARTNADSAFATQINTVQVELGDDIASVQTTLQANIDVVDDEVTNIGALYTVVVDVNGFAGGFGIYNTGATIDAGFNVDTFWVGSEGDRVKPFIITGGVVYMSDVVIQGALIEDLEVDKLTTGIFGAEMTVHGDVILASTGKVRAGKTTYGAGTGFIFDLSGANPRFDIGSTSEYIRWTGSVLEIGGDVIATGNIVANGVSVIGHAYTATEIQTTSNSTWETLQTLAVTSTGSTHSIDISVFVRDSVSWGKSFYLRVQRNGSTILDIGGSGHPGFYVPTDDNRMINISFTDTPSAGSVTYTLQINKFGAGGLHTLDWSHRTIRSIEMKR